MSDSLSFLGDPMGLAQYAAASQQDPVHKQLQAVGIPTTPSQPQPDISQTGSVGPDGSYVPPAAVPTPQQAQSANPLGAVANAVVPAAMAGGDNPDGTPKPVPAAAPQQAPAQAPGLYDPKTDSNQPSNTVDPKAGLYVPPTDPGSSVYTPPAAANTGMAKPPPVDSNPTVAVSERPATPSTGPDGAAVNSVEGNNFGNIRPTGASTGFNSYATPADGVAAMSQNLTAYSTQHGINTLSGLTSRWAPKGDGNNDPVAYANTLSKLTGIPVNQPINLADPTIQQKLIPAMAQVEHGRPGLVDPDTLQQGIQLASSGKPIQMGKPLQSTTPGSDVTLAATSAQPATSADQRLALAQSLQGGGGNNDIASQLRAVGLNPNTMMGNPFLALGAGLAGKRTLGEGISAAAGNLNQLYMQRGDLGFKLAQMGLENKRLDNQMAYQNDVLGIRQAGMAKPTGAPFQLEAGNPALPPGSAPGWYQHDGLGRLVPSGAPASNVNSDPTRKGQQAAATTAAKDAASDADEINSEALEAQKKQPLLDQAMKLVQSGQASAGPGLAQLKRNIANYLGISITGTDPNDVQTLTSALSQLRGTGIMGKNMRTQREFNTVMEGLPNMDQSQQTQTNILNALQNINKLKTQMGTAWQGLDDQTRKNLRADPDKLSAWQSQQVQEWSKGVGSGGGIYKQQDPNTGLGFTIH